MGWDEHGNGDGNGDGDGKQTRNRNRMTGYDLFASSKESLVAATIERAIRLELGKFQHQE